LGEFSEAFRGVYKCAYIVGNTLVAKNTKGRQDFFYTFFQEKLRARKTGARCRRSARRPHDSTGKFGDAAVSVVGTYVFL